MVKLSSHSGGSDPYRVARKRMIAEQLAARGITDPRVLTTMEQLPRDNFVDDAFKAQAYVDAPLQIGFGQTISQPYIVALMTQALGLSGREKILEIGTGCGYQAAILARLGGQLYTIERVKELGMAARQRFKELGLTNVVIRIGDGSGGWPEAAPFDRILVACAGPVLPTVLLDQLALDGILVMPVGEGDKQTLQRARRTASGIQIENLGPCRFVKLIGKHGYVDDDLKNVGEERK